MEKINQDYKKYLSYMIYGSLMVLSLGLLTSMTLLSLSHILMLIPALYFINKADYKNFPKSAWALLAMILVIILSTVANQDIAINGFKPILKSKYFLFGFLSIAPIAWYLKNYYSDKKLAWLIYAISLATTFATIAGLIGLWSGYNPVLMRAAYPGRNGGLFGMLMNYAHNLSFFLIIIFGFFLYKKRTQKFINTKFLIIVLIINLVGFYFTYTRGAWLGFLFGFSFFFFNGNKKKFITVLGSLIVIGTAAYFIAGHKVLRNNSNNERISQWKAAYYAVKERPVLGYGYLNFELHTTEIKKRYNIHNSDFQGHAHSNFFEMLGATGILGFIAFLAWVGMWFYETTRKDEGKYNTMLACLVCMLVGGATQSTIALGINLFFIMGLYSVWGSLYINEKKS
jgi:O-antigen ligase